MKGLRGQEEAGANLIKAMNEIEMGQQYLSQWKDLFLFHSICLCSDIEERNSRGSEPRDYILPRSLDFSETYHFFFPL